MNKPVSIKLEDTDIRLVLGASEGLFGKDPLGYIPYFLKSDDKVYEFGFCNIRSSPVSQLLGWKTSASLIQNTYKRAKAFEGTFEWFGPEGTKPLTVKWVIGHGPIASLEKLEAWIQHWTFQTWVRKIHPEKESSHAQEVGRWYWEVRKDPNLIRKLVEKAYKLADKPARSVAEVMEKHRDRFHEAHKWDWFYQGCPTEDLPDKFTDFRVFCDSKVKDELDVPGVGLVGLRPHKWVSVPPFLHKNKVVRPIDEDADDDNQILPTIKRKPKCAKT